MDRNKVYAEAIKTWGIREQLTVAVEELSELIKEICKYNRYQENVDKIVEEIADVEIVIAEMKLMFGIDRLVADKRKEKLDRLYHRIEKYRAENGMKAMDE